MMIKIRKIIWLLVLFAMVFVPIFASCQYATFYADKYEGRKCAKGDVYWHYKMTCASNDYAIGTFLLVSYKGKSVKVRVNDRMHYSISGVVDLSKEAFKIIANTDKGKIKVDIKIIER